MDRDRKKKKKVAERRMRRSMEVDEEEGGLNRVILVSLGRLGTSQNGNPKVTSGTGGSLCGPFSFLFFF